MSTYEISKSSLLSLKVEILKKQEEINKSKLENKTFIPASHGQKGPKVSKNKGVDERRNRDFEEDPDLLKKSRQMLEAKSKLYDKLSNKQSDFEDNKHYLVNFNRKASKSLKIHDECPNFDDDPADIDTYQANLVEEAAVTNEDYDDDNVDSDNEWTEYTDSLGRTRTCLKKDLDYMKNKDEKIMGSKIDLKEATNKREQDNIEDKAQHNNEKVNEEFNEKSELLSSDMKRELLRQQWEKEEATLAEKDNVHYQDVLFNEARTHGVGYFAFSKDESERAKQQSELEKLRQETTQKQKLAQDLKKTREKVLKNRIRAAQNRKRARLGLPPLNESDEEREKAEEDSIKEKPVEKKEMTEEEKERELKRQKHVRPWDIGKEGVETPKEHYIYSQEEWVAKKREERNQEFAPPKLDNQKSYRNSQKRPKTVNNSSKNKKFRENSPIDGAASVNPYKSKELPPLSHSDSDSSSEDEDQDRLMQAYKQSQINKDTEPDNKKISFKVTQRSQPTLFSTIAPKPVEPVSISSIVSDSSSSAAITIDSNSTPLQNSSIAQNNNLVSTSSFTPIPIVNELLYSPTQSSDDSSSDDNNDDPSSSNIRAQSSRINQWKLQNNSSSNELIASDSRSKEQYAEIAPPATFEYYGPSGRNNDARGRGKKSGGRMADSIMMGLKYLREQAEKKGKLNRGNDDF